MTTSKPSSEKVCRICCAPLDSQRFTSEVCGGVVCAECARTERVGFKWCLVGLVIIALLQAVMFVLYRYGLVSRAVHDFISLWGCLWILACLLGIYFRLNKRKRLCKSSDDESLKKVQP